MKHTYNEGVETKVSTCTERVVKKNALGERKHYIKKFNVDGLRSELLVFFLSHGFVIYYANHGFFCQQIS